MMEAKPQIGQTTFLRVAMSAVTVQVAARSLLYLVDTADGLPWRLIYCTEQPSSRHGIEQHEPLIGSRQLQRFEPYDEIIGPLVATEAL